MIATTRAMTLALSTVLCAVLLIPGCGEDSPDPRVTDIQETLSFARQIAPYAAILDQDRSDLTQQSRDARAAYRSVQETCGTFTAPGVDSAWPDAHATVARTLTDLCASAVLGTSAGAREARILGPALAAAVEALPDWSPAELDKAIKNRQ